MEKDKLKKFYRYNDNIKYRGIWIDKDSKRRHAYPTKKEAEEKVSQLNNKKVRKEQ